MSDYATKLHIRQVGLSGAMPSNWRESTDRRRQKLFYMKTTKICGKKICRWWNALPAVSTSSRVNLIWSANWATFKDARRIAIAKPFCVFKATSVAMIDLIVRLRRHAFAIYASGKLKDALYAFCILKDVGEQSAELLTECGAFIGLRNAGDLRRKFPMTNCTKA